MIVVLPVRRWLALAFLPVACARQPDESPTHALDRLREAIASGDTTTLRQHLDVHELAKSMLLATAQLAGMPDPGTEPPEFLAATEERLRALLGLAEATDSLSGETLDDIYSEPVEFLEFGDVRIRRDTALVQRIVRLPALDTTIHLESSLVPNNAGSWRMVGVPNLAAVVSATMTRRLDRVARANERGQEALAAAIRSSIAVTRVPLKDWGAYALDIRISLTNVSGGRLRLTGLALHGPKNALMDDSAWVTLRPQALELATMRSATIELQIPLTTSDRDLAAIADAPNALRVAFDTLQVWKGDTAETYVQYRSWKAYLRSLDIPVSQSNPALIATDIHALSPNKQLLQTPQTLVEGADVLRHVRQS